MDDWLSRFREFKKSTGRLTPRDNRDDSDNNSTKWNPARCNTHPPKAIVPFDTFVTGGGGGERLKTPPNAEIEVIPISDGVAREHFTYQLRPSEKCNRTSTAPTPGDNSDNSDNSAPCYLDFETRNTGGCKLQTAGAWRYAADPAAEIITLSYRAGDGEHRLWTPGFGRCDRLAALVADPDTRFVCHSAFEQAIWQHIMVERFGFAPVPIARWHDTQAACAYHALPLKLGHALTVTNSPVVKDEEGRRLTLSLGRSNRGTGEYPTLTPERRERVATYNRIDVDGATALDKALGPLPKRERRLWELDQTINQRGIKIDLEYVHAAKSIADQLIAGLTEEFRELTGGLNPTQVKATQIWLADRELVLDRLGADAIAEALELDLVRRFQNCARIGQTGRSSL
jgi:hypothetical protein